MALRKCPAPQPIDNPPSLYRDHLAHTRSCIQNGEAVKNNFFDRVFNNTAQPYRFTLSLYRNQFVNQYSWGIPNQKALGALYYNAPIIEVGAGAGYWAHCLQKMGAAIKAYDTDTDNSPNHLPVQEGGPDVITDHPGHTLFLCWPPYDMPMAYRCLKKYEGDRLFYVGEHNGCTADDAFHKLLAKEFELIETITLDTFPNIHDAMYIFDRSGQLQ